MRSRTEGPKPHLYMACNLPLHISQRQWKHKQDQRNNNNLHTDQQNFQCSDQHWAHINQIKHIAPFKSPLPPFSKGGRSAQIPLKPLSQSSNPLLLTSHFSPNLSLPPPHIINHLKIP